MTDLFFSRNKKNSSRDMIKVLSRMKSTPTDTDYMNLAIKFFNYKFTVICDKNKLSYFTNPNSDLLLFTSNREAYKYSKQYIPFANSKKIRGYEVLALLTNSSPVKSCIIDPTSSLNLRIDYQYLLDLYDYLEFISKTVIRFHTIPKKYIDIINSSINDTLNKYNVSTTDFSVFLFESKTIFCPDKSILQLIVLIKKSLKNEKKEKLRDDIFYVLSPNIGKDLFDVWFLEDKPYIGSEL